MKGTQSRKIHPTDTRTSTPHQYNFAFLFVKARVSMNDLRKQRSETLAAKMAVHTRQWNAAVWRRALAAMSTTMEGGGEGIEERFADTAVAM
jgi:hypothetical protein